MQLIRGLHNIKSPGQGTVLTIGNFDGVHRGHQAILDRLIESAEEHDLPATVMFFEPHPEEVFQGENAPARLSRCREKVTYFRDHGIDQVLEYRDNAFIDPTIDPEIFCRQKKYMLFVIER